VDGEQPLCHGYFSSAQRTSMCKWHGDVTHRSYTTNTCAFNIGLPMYITCQTRITALQAGSSD
jgi:hypothetical protein